MKPRFSIRSLAIAVTLVCVYFGTWEMTKRWGVTGSQQILDEYQRSGILLPASISPPLEDSPMPFVVRRIDFTSEFSAASRFYLWIFGARVELWN